jgi:phosphoglycolate phosphatase
MSLRCVYTDLDGTLLGRGGSLFRDADGGFTLLPARGLEACHRAGVEVVLKSGRRKSSVMEDARLIGQSSYIYEVGSGLVIDGEETLLTGSLVPRDGKSVHTLIAESGAPALLFERFADQLDHHSPWHEGREVSHLMRGRVDTAEANALLAEHGHDDLRLVDNGATGADPTQRVYHLIPRAASKAKAVARHMQARGYAPGECIAVGDSREDLGVAEVVGRFFLVANAAERDAGITAVARANVEVTEARNGEGFYEAVVRSLAEG